MASTYGDFNYGSGNYGNTALTTSYGVVALPVVFTKSVTARRLTYGQVTAPFTFIKAVSGINNTAPIKYYGKTDFRLTFKKAVSAKPIPLPPGAVDPPTIFVVAWDKVGERVAQSGIDRGVLYLNDGRVIPWSGLTGMEEAPSSELKSFYLDGVKYLENLTPGDFVGKLKAITYPDEFDSVCGIVSNAPGLEFHEQPPKSFSLSYRTLMSNDVLGQAYGYKIHILYNLKANPDSHAFETIDESGFKATEFSWSLTGTPSRVVGLRPTVHITIDSTKTPEEIMRTIESILYGSSDNAPFLPSAQAINEIFGNLGTLIIINNGDGTWSAIDTSELGNYLTMVSDTEFRLDNVNAIYLDADTYQLSSTN